MANIRWYMDNKKVNAPYFVSEVMALKPDQFVETGNGTIDHTLIMLNKTMDGAVDDVSSVAVDVNSIIRVVLSDGAMDTQSLYKVCGAKLNDPEDTVTLFLSKLQEVTYNPNPRLFVGGNEAEGVSFRMPPAEVFDAINDGDGHSYCWIATASVSFKNDDDLLKFFQDLDNGKSYIRYADPICMHHVHDHDYEITAIQDYVCYDELKAEIVFFMG